MKIRHIAPVVLIALWGCKEKEATPSQPAAPPAAASAVVAKVAEPAPAQGAFEGEVEIALEMKSKAQAPTTLHALFKGNKIRFDAPSGAMGGTPGGGASAGGSAGLTASKAYQIISIDEGKMRTVVDSQKLVVEMDIAKFAEQMKGMTGGAPAPSNEPPPKVNKTGKTDTIVGRSCEEWEVVNPKSEKLTMCIAKGGGWPSIPAALMPGNDWAEKVLDKDNFPLRIVLTGSDGAEKMRMQVTRMDKKAIDDAQFKAPEGYRVMDMSNMMGGMGAMGSNMMTAPISSGSGRPQLKLPPNVEKMIQEARAKAAAKNKK
jgi:hypothetical protein